MHANQIHVNMMELVQRQELITSALVCLGMKGKIATNVGLDSYYGLNIFSFHSIKQRFQIDFIYCQNLSIMSLIYVFFNGIAGHVLCSTNQHETS